MNSNIKFSLQAKSGNVKSGNVKNGNVKSGNVKSENVKSGNVKSGNVKNGNVKSGNAKSGNAKNGNVKNGNTKKECNEFYVPTNMLSQYSNDNRYSIENVLLCQYDMLDVAIYISMNSISKKILLHNFANNDKPCNGLWDSNYQENKMYRRTNIKELIVPIQHKLYPIQANMNKKDSFGKYSVNMLITENCMLQKTESGKCLQTSAFVDVASLNAIVAPSERNMDFYVNSSGNMNELTRYDYAIEDDKKKMESRIRFLINYAIGESYDYLVTGSWGMGSFLNPHWGIINLWNRVISTLPNSDLKIIFCIPVQNDIDGEAEFIYKFFNRYLLGQSRQIVNFNKLHNENKIKDEVNNISKDEHEIKSKIYGLVWGTALSEINNYYVNYQYNLSLPNADSPDGEIADSSSSSPDGEIADSPSSNSSNVKNKWILLNSEYSIDWDICTDQTVLAMRTMTESDPQMDINPIVFANKLVEWKTYGFSELKDRPNTCNDNIIKHILSQPKYAYDPMRTAKHVYKSKGMEDISNSSFSRNALNGIFKDYIRRSLITCRLLQPDEACQISCLVHSFIIRSIWEGKYITTEDWGKISNMCHQILDRAGTINIQKKIDFDSYWMIARNYQYKINDGIEHFISQNLKPNSYTENHTFIPMTIAMILMYDIQSHIRVDGRLVKDMMNVIEIPVADDKLRTKKINFNKELPPDYYFCKMESLSKINSNNICNAVAGSILGLACFDNVYNDLAIKDSNGNKIESNSQQWIQYANYKEWLNKEIEKFVSGYLGVRRQIILKNNKIKQADEEKIQKNIKKNWTY